MFMFNSECLIIFALPLVSAGTEIASQDTTNWAREPDGRGTFSLIFSCILTLTICVWSALHLNVPPRKTTPWRLAIEKTTWVLYGIFAPELVVATAASQFILAKWLKREIQNDAKLRLEQELLSKDAGLSYHEWTMDQCFFAVMGGCVINMPPLEDGEKSNRQCTITAEGIRLLSFVGRLPKIDQTHIQDKSKADWIAKSFVAIQAGWMVLQIIARLVEKMPVSLLEINTCGHVACAAAIYVLWWSKPLDVQDPTFLKEDQDMFTLMRMCSSMNAKNGITDIRCFIHKPEEAHLNSDPAPEAQLSSEDEQPQDRVRIRPMATHLSVGSRGSKNPKDFIGYTELIGFNHSIADAKGTRRTQRLICEYEMDIGAISDQCLLYTKPPYDNCSLQHGNMYCRRRNLKGLQNEHNPMRSQDLSSASDAVDLIWRQCELRKSYEPYYFTTVPGIGKFVGETDYVLPHIVNIPSLTNLTMGQVNIHRDLLPSVLALTAAAYGGLHLAGWADYFPTNTERLLWISAALIIACSGLLLWMFFLARQFWPAFDAFWSRNRYITRDSTASKKSDAVDLIKLCIIYSLLVAFGLARVFLVVEAFVSLREAPVGLYITPEWTDFIPHL
jgi:hypothetical protein